MWPLLLAFALLTIVVIGALSELKRWAGRWGAMPGELARLWPGDELSPHLRSRVRVGEVFLESGVPTLVLQAGVVIGSGSASFEMIRHLTEVLPYMPAPKWVRNHIQPIAIRDVLHYLLGAARVDQGVNRAVDIGGRKGQHGIVCGRGLGDRLRQRRTKLCPSATPSRDAARNQSPHPPRVAHHSDAPWGDTG